MTEVISGKSEFPIKIESDSVINLIGNTPLLPVSKIVEAERLDIEIFAKAEWFNPGGSVKDRPAWNMIEQGFLKGELDYNKTIIDATSGNTGIALAMIGAALGIKVKLCIPANASKERLTVLKAYNASLVLTDPLEGTDGAISKVQEIVEEDPEQYFYTDQYTNPANWQAHYYSTGPEIFNQTNGHITHFISGLGTSGTFRGVTTKLKEENPEIQCISLQPEEPLHGIEGLKHMETSVKPQIYDPEIADKDIFVSTNEAYEMTRRLATEEGLLVGISSGAALAGAIKIGKEIDKGVIVTIFCDRGDRYLTDKFWGEDA